MIRVILLTIALLAAFAGILKRAIMTSLHMDWAAVAVTLFALGLVSISARRRRKTASNSGGTTKKPRWFSFSLNTTAFCLLLFVTAYLMVRIPAPMGEGPAGGQVQIEAFQQIWSQRPVLLLGLGDSITTGYGAITGQGYFDMLSHNDDKNLPDMKGKDLSAVFPNLSTSCLASNSSNSLDHFDESKHISLRTKDTYGIICITTGGIDIIHNYGKFAPRELAMYGATIEQATPWIENFEERVGIMMERLREKFPGGCSIFLATIFDPTDGVGDIENAGVMFWLPAWPDGLKVLHGYNDAIRRVTQKYDYVHLVDIHKVMLGHGIHCQDNSNPHYCEEDPTYWYFLNVEDPNRRGYDAIRRVFIEKMISVLRLRF